MLALWKTATGVLYGKFSSPGQEGYKGWRWGICGVGDWYFWLKFRANITVWQPITPHVFKMTSLTLFEVQPYNFPCRQSSSMDCPWPSHSWALNFLASRVGTDFSSWETWAPRAWWHPACDHRLWKGPGALGWDDFMTHFAVWCRRPSKDLTLCNMIWVCVCPPMSRLRQ